MVFPFAPIIAVVIAVVLIIIGLKIAKWVFWSLAIIVIIGGFVYFFMFQPAPEQLIGGDTDDYGCLIGAGYSWCGTKQKCLRVWEELCPESFCEQENTTEVQICDNYVKVTDLEESTYYKEDLTGNRTEFTCPVVTPDEMTPKCREVFNLSCGENIC